MKKKRLGGTDLELSVMGLGAWAFGGGDWAFGWGPQEDGASIQTIHRAVELGINWIDTAAVYGLGHSEEVVGKALSELSLGERPFVFTKCGLPWKKRKIRHRLTSDSIRREIEGSLTRLRVEAIDLYQIHWPDASPDGPAPELEEGWSTLVKLREEGKTRHVGVSNVSVGQLERLRPLSAVESVQPPYSLLRRGAERDLLPYCAEQSIGVIVYSPMESGLLTGTMTRERLASLPESDWRKSKSEQFREPRFTRNLEIVETLRGIGRAHDVSPGEVAVAWCLRQPAVTGAIVGARQPQQIEATRGAADLVLTPQELSELDRVSPDDPS